MPGGILSVIRGWPSGKPLGKRWLAFGSIGPGKTPGTENTVSGRSAKTPGSNRVPAWIIQSNRGRGLKWPFASPQYLPTMRNNAHD